MYRQYKKQLINQNQAKLKKILDREIEGLNEQEKEHVNQDIHTRPDLLQKFLLEDIQEKSSKQLSLLNEFRYDLITKMPGIQYDQISTYEQIKSQRSDQSQERRFQNQTVMHGGSNSHLVGLDFNQNSMSLSRGEGFGLGLGFGMNSGKVERSFSLIKSRNQPSHKIVMSRSGDLVTQSFTTKHQESMLGHKRSQGGMIYDNFLSMANNTNSIHLSQQDLDFREMINKQKTVALNKTSKEDQTADNDKKHLTKVRIQSQNTHHQPSFSLNKTLDLQNPSILGNRMQSQTVQQNQMLSKKSSTTRNNALHQSQILQALNNTQGLIKQAFSPKVNLNGSTTEMENTLNLSLKRNVGAGSKSFYKERSLKQNLLKEALTRQIQKERSKVGLEQNYSAKKLTEQMRNNLSPSKEITVKLKNQGSLSRLDDRGLTTQKNSAIKMNTNGNQQSNKRLLPHNPSKIDLMNPKQKKISRNEERKLAMRKGFLNPQQHESFYQFLYSPNEELNKLAMMQVIQRKVESGQIRLGKNKDQMSFSNLLYSGLNEQFNHSSLSQSNNDKEKDFMARFNQMNDANNQIQFQRRLLQDPELLQANELFLTTIKNQNNWIQQKQQMPQSPSMSNTEMSSIRKGHRRHIDKQNFYLQEGDDTYPRVLSPSNGNYRLMPNQSQMEQFNHSSSQNEGNSYKNLFTQKQVKENSMTQILSTSQKKSKDEFILGDENLDSMETRPLKVIEEDIGYMMSRTHVANLKQSHFSQKDINEKNQSNQKKKLSEKQKLEFSGLQNITAVNSNNQPTVRKDFKAINPSNKSPLIQTGKYSAHNSKNIKDISIQSNLSNFESQIQQSKNNETLSRKRSTPALGQDKLSSNSLKQHQNFKSQLMQKTKSGENQVEKKQQQQQFQYFKKRPLNQNIKNSKNSHVITTTVDLIAKPKFTDQNPSRMDISKEMSSLRISPIPNMNDVLNQQQQRFDQSINLHELNNQQNSSAGNPSGQDGSSSQPHYNNSSSGISEDQINYKGKESFNNHRLTSLSNNQRDSVHQNNFSSLQNPQSSNYQSRQSEKSFLKELNQLKMQQSKVFPANIGLENQNQNNVKEEALFSSITQLLEQDLFERAHMTINGPQTARNESLSHQKNFTSSKLSKGNQGGMFNFSQRSSSNQQLNFQLRASNVSGEGQIRPSNTSSNNDLFKFRREKSNQKFTMIENNSSSRQSDVLSQYEPQNNISVSIMKSSPRMNQGKTVSRTTKNHEQSFQRKGLINHNSHLGKQNFQMQGIASKIETVQPSVMNSHDTQNMKLLLIALKQNIPQSQSELNSANISKIKSSNTLKNMNSKTGQSINQSLSQNNSAAQKQIRLQQRIDCNGQSVNVVNIDLNRGNKMIISPKGLSGQKLKEGQLGQSGINSLSGQKALQRNSSIEEKKINAQSLQNSGYGNIGNGIKKQIRSPQPQMEIAQSLSSKMKALKSMHSQEFNLKEKSIRNGQDKNEVSNFSSDPMVELSKDFNKSTSKKIKDSQHLQRSAFYNYSSSKNLKDFQSERSHVKELNFNNFIVEPSGNHKFSSELQQSSRKQKNHPQQVAKVKDLNQTLQNTSIHKIKDQIILKTFEEQKQFYSVQQNSRKDNTSSLIDPSKKQQKMTSLILEEPFIDDSPAQSPNSHQSESPQQNNDADTPQDDFQNHSNLSNGNPQIKFGMVKDFQTLNAHASSKIGESFVNKSDMINPQSLRMVVVSERELETVRNNELQIINFGHQTKAQAVAAKKSIQAHNQAKYRESTHELDIELQEVDQQKQGFEIAKQQSKLQINQARHGSVEDVQRVSQINKEVDDLINEMSQIRAGTQIGALQGSRTSKSKVQPIQKQSQVARHQESVDLMRESLESSKFSNRMRVQSQYQYSNMLQPLNEIKQIMNRQNIHQSNQEGSQQYRAGDKLLKGMRKSEHLGSYKSENSLSQFDGSSKNSNFASQEGLGIQGTFKVNGSKRNERRKKSHYRHGMTTCFVQPGGKESNQYMKKDLNQDAFCKINSHIGDIDNDPHTPKSDQSLSSHEKNSRKHKRRTDQASKRSKPNTFYMEEENDFGAHLRVHNPRLQDDKNEYCIQEFVSQRENNQIVNNQNLGAKQNIKEGNLSGRMDQQPYQELQIQNNLRIRDQFNQIPHTVESDATHQLYDYDYSSLHVNPIREVDYMNEYSLNDDQHIQQQYQSQDVTSNYNQHIEFLYSDDQCRQIDQLLHQNDSRKDNQYVNERQYGRENFNSYNGQQDDQQELNFDEADLNDFEDKYTSRDKNFNRLRLQQQILLQQQNFQMLHQQNQ